MNKNLVLFVIAALLIFIGLCRCSEIEKNQVNTDDEKLIGTWTNTSLFEGNNLTVGYRGF